MTKLNAPIPTIVGISPDTVILVCPAMTGDVWLAALPFAGVAEETKVVVEEGLVVVASETVIVS